MGERRDEVSLPPAVTNSDCLGVNTVKGSTCNRSCTAGSKPPSSRQLPRQLLHCPLGVVALVKSGRLGCKTVRAPSWYCVPPFPPVFVSVRARVSSFHHRRHHSVRLLHFRGFQRCTGLTGCHHPFSVASMSTTALLRKKVFARGVLSTLGKSAISPSQFMRICTASERVPAAYRMTTAEADAFLRSLGKAGAVLQVTDDQVHLRPVEVVNAVHLHAGLPQVSCSLPTLEASRSHLTTAAQEGLARNEEKLLQVVAKQKNFWAFTAVLSGAQMAVLAYLQFQVYGWDVMEPVTYFVTTITALATYAYFLYFRREYSYHGVDDSLVPELLTRDIKVSKMKTAEWIEADEMAKELERLNDNIEDTAAALLALARERERPTRSASSTPPP